MSDANLPVMEVVEVKPDVIIEVDLTTGVNPADNPQANTPTNTPTTALGTNEGTVVGESNNNRSHACDTMMYLDRAVAFAKFFGGQIVAVIRRGIQAALAALGISPGSNALIQFLKQIKRYADEITEFLQDIQNFYRAFIEAVAKIKALIDYILSLPERLIAFFINCVREAYAELQTFFLDSVSNLADSDQSQGLITAATEAFNSVTEAVQTATVVAAQTAALPATAIATVLSGSSTPAQQDAAVQELYSGFNNSKTYANA